MTSFRLVITPGMSSVTVAAEVRTIVALAGASITARDDGAAHFAAVDVRLHLASAFLSEGCGVGVGLYPQFWLVHLNN